ncbi:hypothetical protein BDV98DRAFT_567695 [Pterulicium gracile]|uniref:Uncharacterized protein n=1 Tax=Pterulicium gracile TaxID=1884261 RepID=A0A5C3QIR0_9AGAR|nr:hypothetical protein BDV98DRAFT_567695 [Pterula gracilis]
MKISTFYQLFLSSHTIFACSYVEGAPSGGSLWCRNVIGDGPTVQAFTAQELQQANHQDLHGQPHAIHQFMQQQWNMQPQGPAGQSFGSGSREGTGWR